MENTKTNRSSDVLVVEISGKRAGTSKQRPTENAIIDYDHLIISNNSEGYETDWEIVNVPDDYKEWYVNNIKCSENAWYAPMNRSYAIKYAREHGYKYLVQLDDNICRLEIATMVDVGKGIIKRYRHVNLNLKNPTMFNDFIEMQRVVLENTNAAMVGFGMASVGVPDNSFLTERYVYSFFMLNLEICPDIFQGDFEDDIEYRLKCAQMGLPVIQIGALKYGKTGQNKNKDLSGCRAEYAKAGIKRGEHMSRLYGDIYSAKMSKKGHSIHCHADEEAINFKHIIKPIKVGVIVKDMQPIKDKLKQILETYALNRDDQSIYRERKKKVHKVNKE